jgi:septin family protein
MDLPTKPIVVDDIVEFIETDEELRAFLYRVPDMIDTWNIRSYISIKMKESDKTYTEAVVDFITRCILYILDEGLKFQNNKQVPMEIPKTIDDVRVISLLYFLNQSTPDMSSYELELKRIKERIPQEKQEGRINILKKFKDRMMFKPNNELIKHVTSSGERGLNLWYGQG